MDTESVELAGRGAPRARRRRGTLALLAAVTVLSIAACEGSNRPPEAVLESAVAHRLAGSWVIRLEVDPGSMSSAPRTGGVTGTVAFVVDRRGRTTTTMLSTPTHEGVFDVDFTPFGWPSQPSDEAPSAAARVQLPDSVYIVFERGEGNLAIRLWGQSRQDAVTGIWRAEGSRSGGASGRFTMTRDASTSAP